MSVREIIYLIFYMTGFLLAVILGVKSGFTGTHTPPAPFIIEVLLLPIGFIAFVIDARWYRSTKVHKIGLVINTAIVIFVLALAFAGQA